MTDLLKANADAQFRPADTLGAERAAKLAAFRAGQSTMLQRLRLAQRRERDGLRRGAAG